MSTCDASARYQNFDCVGNGKDFTSFASSQLGDLSILRGGINPNPSELPVVLDPLSILRGGANPVARYNPNVLEVVRMPPALVLPLPTKP